MLWPSHTLSIHLAPQPYCGPLTHKLLAIYSGFVPGEPQDKPIIGPVMGPQAPRVDGDSH